MTQTSHEFQAEVTQLLNLMIHSLYSEREIFLRELISNASDACDKLRFRALTDHGLLAGDEDLRVVVRGDGEANTLTIEDNGIGLTEAEAVANLGTIARSGTKEFVNSLEEADAKDAASLIGQFGVGFYSAFMVADRIVVESRSALVSSDDGVRWESTGDGSYQTEAISRPKRGTTITLHLKDDAKEFAEHYRLRSLIKRYSDYVSYPIMLPKPASGEDDEQAGTLEQVNAGQPLWTRPKGEVSDEQHQEFFRGQLHQFGDAATWIHAQVEGTMAFTLLLYVPAQRPMDLFDRGKRGLSLYVRRVFIMDDCEDLLPEYLRFVKGVVDSDDLPLNVSREMLQEHRVVSRLRKQVTKRVLDHLQGLADGDEEQRKTFAAIEDQFGPVLREGLVNDFEFKDQLTKLVRYRSTWTEAQEQADEGPPVKTSLAEYVERMADGQDHVYYITAPSLPAAKASPHLEGFAKRGIEVLFCVDPVDEWAVNSIGEVEGKTLVSVAKGAADLGEEEGQDLSEHQEAYRDFLGFAEGKVEGVKEIRLTARLTDSPCCLVADEHGMSTNMEEMMRKFGQDIPEQERILELNPDHPVIQGLKARHASGGDEAELGEHLALLRDQALLAEGARVKDPAAFAKRVQKLMAASVAS